MSAAPVSIVEAAVGGPARLVEMHDVYYRRAWGFGDYFRTRVASDLAQFQKALPHADCGLWFATQGDAVVGSIAIDGREASRAGAHLRWFIVDDSVRGAGVGAELIDTALAFCARRRFSSVHLSTFAGLDAARRLYESRGFRLTWEREGESWGVRVMEQRFDRAGAA